MADQKVVLLAAQKPFAKAPTAEIVKIGEAAGLKVIVLESYAAQEDLVKASVDVDAMIVRSDAVNQAVVDAANKLKLVVRAGAGYDTIDTAACTKKNIVVMNTPGQNSNAVAELVFGMLIHLARVGYTGKMGSELRGKKIGLHGFGYIGQYVSKIAAGFGMEVLAFDPFLSAEKFAEFGVKQYTDLAALYKDSNIVSIHCPLNKDTRGSVNANLLTSMPKGATLINTARAEVVDEAALRDMMEKRPDFKYGTDVIFSKDAGKELKEKYGDRLLYSSVKSGAQTDEANTNCGYAAINQIIEYFKSGCVKFQVNKA